jgi:hypothetical protein
VLDFDGHVVGDVRPAAVQGFRDAHGVGGAVEEVGVAKGDVLGSGGNLAGDVFQHHVRLHDEEAPAVDRNDGAVAAEVLAAAAGLGVADDPRLAAGQGDVSVLPKGRQPRAIGDAEGLPRQRNRRLRLSCRGRRISAVGGEPLDERDESRFELASQDRVGSQSAQKRLIHRRVETVEAEMGGGVEVLDSGDEPRREPGGGVHRDVEGDQVRGGDGAFIQPLDGQVKAGNIRPRFSQPSRRGGYPERLPPQFVS